MYIACMVSYIAKDERETSKLLVCFKRKCCRRTYLTENIHEYPEFDPIQSSNRGNDDVCHDFINVNSLPHMKFIVKD